jgi:hypothetical protein
MKIIEIITEAKKKTSFEFTKLKKVKNAIIEAYGSQSSGSIDSLNNQSRGLLAPGGMLKRLKADLKYALETGESAQKVKQLKDKIAELEKKQKVSEAVEPPKVEKYPDSKAGVLKFFQNPKEVKQTFAKSLDLPNCDIHADPQVEGVWAIDSMKTGSRVIVYLGGYKDPWGEPRMFNDFEEGGFPFKMVRSFVRQGKLTRKQLKVWEKLGNLEPGDIEKLDKEFEDDYFYTGKK